MWFYVELYEFGARTVGQIRRYEILHASHIPTSPQRATFMENEYGWFMRVYGMSFVSSEILKPEPRKHKKIKAQNSEVGTNYRPK